MATRVAAPFYELRRLQKLRLAFDALAKQRSHALCAAESGRSRIGRERCRVAGRRAAVGALTGERRRQKVRQPTNVTHSRSAIGSVF